MVSASDGLLAVVRQAVTLSVADAPTARFCLALSGGVDSTVLLDLLATLCRQWPDARLRAAHVNHALYPDALRWQRQAQDQAGTRGVGIRVLTLAAPPGGPEGTEAAARGERYRVLGEQLAAGEYLVTAHHRDDQLETFLLQMLRGSGPAGLAAMPALRKLGRGFLLRPLLSVSRQQILDHARQTGLQWCEDQSNLDTRFARNFLRHQVLPDLIGRWPEAAENAARSAELCAEAADLLDEIGRNDLGIGSSSDCAPIPLDRLRHLADARLRNALRSWIRQRGFRMPGKLKLDEIVAQMLGARADAQPCIRWDGAEIRRYRDCLYLSQALGDAPDALLRWDPGQVLLLPGNLGQLEWRDARDGERGLPAPALERAVTVRFRGGGEMFRPIAGRNKSLGKWFQEKSIPPWLRERWPLVFIDDRLAWVPELGPAAWIGKTRANNEKTVAWTRRDDAISDNSAL